MCLQKKYLFFMSAAGSPDEAEAKAIEATLHRLSDILTRREKEKNDIVIFSDAKSVLEALENDDSKDKTIRKLSRTIGEVIADHSINITLQGNERADTLAKQGARCIQQNNNASYTTAKQTIKQHKTEDWRNEWANSTTGRSIFTHMTTPNPRDS